MTQDTLVIEDLVTRFDTPRGQVAVVDGAFLRVPARTSVGIVGESGSGKSMLTRSVLGLTPKSAEVTASRVEFAGQDIRGITSAQQREILGKQIGVVLQDPFLSLIPAPSISCAGPGRLAGPAALRRDAGLAFFLIVQSLGSAAAERPSVPAARLGAVARSGRQGRAQRGP